MYFELKPKYKDIIRRTQYHNTIVASIATMFVFKDFPDTVNTRFIPIYNILEGSCAFWKNQDGDWIVSHVNLGGKPDPNGLGTIAICSTDNGEVKQFDNWKTNPEVVVWFNNSVMAPDLNVDRIADILSEVDKSMVYNVIYSRYLPMPVARDENTRKAIDDAIQHLIKGELKTILSLPNELDELLNETGTNSKEPIPIVNISDVKNSDRLQYLSKFHDDIVRWFYNLYGMDINATSKLAQQNNAEIHAMQGASMIIPTNMFDEAQKAVKELNKKFGWNCSVEYNTPWVVDMQVDENGEIQTDEMLDPDEHIETLEDGVDKSKEDTNEETEETEDKETGEDDKNDD